MTAVIPKDAIQKVVGKDMENQNLLNFISNDSAGDMNQLSKKPPMSPRPQSVSPKPPAADSNSVNDTKGMLKIKRRGVLSRPKSRLRSASAGRNPEKDLRARYWTFLFENLHRAVDEIYQTCEMDESIVESKEAIMMLENYSKDFDALIQYINVNKNYEKTAAINRPTSLAWEVRKSSPGKSLLKNIFIEKFTSDNSKAKRILTFDSSSELSEVKDVPMSVKVVSDPSTCKSADVAIHDFGLGISPQNATPTQVACDVKISVVSEEEVFPCNNNIVINEVHCLQSPAEHTDSRDTHGNIEKPPLSSMNERPNVNGHIEVEKSKTDSTENKNGHIVQGKSEMDPAKQYETTQQKQNGTVGLDKAEIVPTEQLNQNDHVTLEKSKAYPTETTVVKGMRKGKWFSESSCQTDDYDEESHTEIGISDSKNLVQKTISGSLDKGAVTKRDAHSAKNAENSAAVKPSSMPSTATDNKVRSTLNKSLSRMNTVPKIARSPRSTVDCIKSPLKPETASAKLTNKTTVSNDRKEPSKSIQLKEPTKSTANEAPTTTVSKSPPATSSKPPFSNDRKEPSKSLQLKEQTKSTANEAPTTVSKSPTTTSSKPAFSNDRREAGKSIQPKEPTKSTANETTMTATKSPPARSSKPASSNDRKEASKNIQPKEPTKPTANEAPTTTTASKSPPATSSKPAFSKMLLTRKVSPQFEKQNAVKNDQLSQPPPTALQSAKKEATQHDKQNLRNRNESAIKRNISYVQSLSSRNHQEKSENEVKRAQPSRYPNSYRLSKKSESLTALNRPTNLRKCARKTSSFEKIPENLNSNVDGDSDGWEMVRGRNRCRNSPAKKLPFPNKSQDNQAAQIAALNQSRMGGFPYTTTKPLNSSNYNSPKTSETSKKAPKSDSSESPKSSSSAESKSSSCSTSKTTTDSLNRSSSSERCKTLDSNGKDDPTESRYKNSEDGYPSQDQPNKNAPTRKSSLFLPLEVCAAVANNNFPSRNRAFVRSSSAPCVRSYDVTRCRLSKALCISDQSLDKHKYITLNRFKKCLDRGLNSAKKRVKKAKDVSMDKSGSLDESDAGLTSDDQDGPMSHDEAFDVQCQELYDTAWKYKILEQQVHKLELSWGEQMDLFDMELRTPGRALEMHEKLSSPFRKKSLYESIRVCNEKQLKAQEQRERLLEEKAQKFKIIEKKRQEMKTLLEQRQEKQRVLMEQKLQKAEEKRKRQLDLIIRKAHDEEEKVNEIAFINSLEAQNKRHDLISKEKDHEARLHDIQEERQRKLEEKAAKEAAAEGRRKVLEAERQARLNEMQEKRKIRDHKVEQLFLVKEKERQELANQKARDRELRLSALSAQQQTTIEELQKKIQLKQEESARRHEENMEQIRQKAFELSVRNCSSNNDDVPQPLPYETKKICTICNVLIGSEVYLLSHLHGKKHQESVKLQYQGQDPSREELELYNLKHIVDASTDQLNPNIALDKERQRALKKRCKKLRLRMSNKGQMYESNMSKACETSNSNMKTRMDKVLADLKKLSSSIESGCNDSSILPAVERNLNNITNIFQKKLHQQKTAFMSIGGITALMEVYYIVAYIPVDNILMFKKVLNNLSSTLDAVTENSYEVCKYILLSNKIGNLLDLLIHRLNKLIPEKPNYCKSSGSNIPLDATAGKLLHLLTNILTILTFKSLAAKKEESEKENQADDFNSRIQDVISYIVSIGVVDKLSQFFNCIQGTIVNQEEVASFLLDCIAFLTALIKLNSDCSADTKSSQKNDDPTQLIATFRVTNMVGSVSLLYGLLLHGGGSSRDEITPTPLPKPTEMLAFSVLCMLNHMAFTSLQAFQSILGSEGLSLQFRHIASHLLWYCGHQTSEALLHELILLVGYFVVLNAENQSIIQAGQRPTVLQQLCCLPFLYFSDLELTDILFPTLIACCYNNQANKTILQQEMTSELLSNYIEVKYLNIEGSVKKSVYTSKRWLFATRFSKCHWSQAKQYFSSD